MNIKGSIFTITLSLFSALVLFFFSHCERLEPDTPPIQTIDQDSIITITELRNMFQGEPVAFENLGFYIFGTVTMDDSSGNIYREAFVQDDEAGIILRMSQSGDFKEGDSVRISLKGTVLNDYRSMLQLTELDGSNNVVVQAEGKHLEPILLTISEISTQYQGMLVKLENVQFSLPHAGVPYGNAEELSYENRDLEDCEGNSIIVRTSGYADFASELTPEGNGSIIGLVGEHDQEMQLHIRRTSEVIMDQERCEPPNGNTVTSIDEDFQSYADYDVINQNGWTPFAQVGERDWICRTHEGNHYAQASAYNSPDPENIMWLITPAIDLDAMSYPVFEFESAKAFYTHDGFSLHIATDYDGSNAGSANWQPLEAVLAGETHDNHQWIHSGVIDLSSYSGIVHIAWRYESAAPQGDTGTFRVDNVKLYEQPQ